MPLLEARNNAHEENQIADVFASIHRLISVADHLA